MAEADLMPYEAIKDGNCSVIIAPGALLREFAFLNLLFHHVIIIEDGLRSLHLCFFVSRAVTGSGPRGPIRYVGYACMKKRRVLHGELQVDLGWLPFYTLFSNLPAGRNVGRRLLWLLLNLRRITLNQFLF